MTGTADPIDDPPTGGSVPHKFRQRLFWEWAQQMPRALPAGFITTLYAMASAADPSGHLRFNKGKLITIRAVASAARVDVKDARRYVKAAVAAGVVGMPAEQRNGSAILYAILLSPFPDWDAAVAVLEGSKRKRKHTIDWHTEKNQGGHTPEVPDGDRGGHTPTVWDDEEPPPDEEPWGTHPPRGWGDTPPRGWGDTPPRIPGSSMSSSMTVAEVVSQADVPGGPVLATEDFTGGERWGCGVKRCSRCGSRMADRADRVMCVTCMREES